MLLFRPEFLLKKNTKNKCSNEIIGAISSKINQFLKKNAALKQQIWLIRTIFTQKGVRNLSTSIPTIRDYS